MPRKKKTETKKEDVKGKAKATPQESEEKIKFRAYMKDLRINAPIEYSEREVELRETLNNL